MARSRVGPVQDTHDSSGKFAGSGVIVYGDDGRPAVTFGFVNGAEAHIAAKMLSEVIAKCQRVAKAP